MHRSAWLAVIGSIALATPTLAATTRSQFLTDAMKGDNSEIMLGKIAQSRGHTPAMRSFGTTLVNDHTKAKAQVLAVARPMGVADTQAVMPEAQQERTKLQGMSGAAFDAEFARFMVNDHQKDIAKFQQEAARTSDGAVARLASQQLPTLQKHLHIAETLAGH